MDVIEHPEPQVEREARSDLINPMAFSPVFEREI